MCITKTRSQKGSGKIFLTQLAKPEVSSRVCSLPMWFMGESSLTPIGTYFISMPRERVIFWKVDSTSTSAKLFYYYFFINALICAGVSLGIWTPPALTFVTTTIPGFLVMLFLLMNMVGIEKKDWLSVVMNAGYGY